MGKATIISGGTDGRYTIKIDAGSQQQAIRLETIEASLASVLERIPEAQAEYLAATTKETYAAGALNAAIESYAAAVQANPETASTADVDRLTGDYYAAARFAGEARTRLQDLTLQQRQLESDKANITSAPVSETRQAWCADLTEDAAGEVATIEVPGEPGTVLVAPGGRAPSAGDGALLARELMTPEQAFFNAAILPGWQKWMPTFRTGTITAVDSDNDTADVSLDAATSSAQGLGVNQTSSLSGVPVEYMECNAAAFEVGDPCVVRFDGQRWDAPRVVGFAREPKPCYFWPEYVTVSIPNRFQPEVISQFDTGLRSYAVDPLAWPHNTCTPYTLSTLSDHIPSIVWAYRYRRKYIASSISFGTSEIVGSTLSSYESNSLDSFFADTAHALWPVYIYHGGYREPSLLVYNDYPGPTIVEGLVLVQDNETFEVIGSVTGALDVCLPNSYERESVVTGIQNMSDIIKSVIGIPDSIIVNNKSKNKNYKFYMAYGHPGPGLYGSFSAIFEISK